MNLEFLHDKFQEKIIKEMYPYFTINDGSITFSKNRDRGSRLILWETYDGKKVKTA